ncbi:MAG TPA: DinB family protein [Gemmatimonadales bacterium]|nr:DinB family protein [Gemmatimonadales bacterium]
MAHRIGWLVAGACAALGVVPIAAHAQAPNPVTDALRSDLTRAQSNLVGSAQEMPADKYGYQPTKEQRTFAQLVLHIAGSNVFMCSTIAGKQRPKEARLEASAPKDSLVARLRSSFEYCHAALQNVTDGDLAGEVPTFGGRKISKAGAIMGLIEDWSDHYAQAAIYLRLNGHLPPTARHRGM